MHLTLYKEPKHSYSSSHAWVPDRSSFLDTTVVRNLQIHA